MEMKVLVTGSNGFLGKALISSLNQQKHTIITYDITEGQDILNVKQLNDVVKATNPDVLIHLAAVADINLYNQSPEIAYNINVVGTQNILKICDDYNIRLLFASTCCCYGNAQKKLKPSTETDALEPTEPYAESKAISEADILSSRNRNHTIMRLATFYGPEMRPALAPAIFLDALHKSQLSKFTVMDNRPVR